MSRPDGPRRGHPIAHHRRRLRDARARYNDIFDSATASTRTGPTARSTARGRRISLYESSYRPDAAWNDVNLDLARAYDYFGLEIDREARDNHDYLPYELEFASYLARREAAVGEDAAIARLDFHDRHLGHAAAGVADRLADEPGRKLRRLRRTAGGVRPSRPQRPRGTAGGAAMTAALQQRVRPLLHGGSLRWRTSQSALRPSRSPPVTSLCCSSTHRGMRFRSRPAR